MERWDLYTADRKPTGLDHIRGEKMPEGLYHLVVHVWIRDSRGRYLLSRRSETRPTFPLMWETVGGSVLKGENSLQGALREVFEEVGIRLDPPSGRLLFSEVRHRYGDLKDVWLFSFDGEADLKAAPTDEVCETAWLTKEQIRALYDSGKLIHTLGYFLERDEF